MAEIILYNIASEVLEKLGSVALREVGLAWGLDDELKSLEGTLCMIKAVVLSADVAKTKQTKKPHHLLNIWLKRLEDAFYHADNVLDEFHYQALHRQVLRRSSGWSIQSKVQEFLLRSSTCVFRSRMGRIIRNITDRLHRIADDRVRFCVMMPGGRSNDEQESSSMSTLNELDFVGRANDKEAILSLLITSSVDEKLSVIPTVGRGGLGKTTLVKLVYNSERCNSDSPCNNLDDKKKLRTLFQDKLNSRRFLLVLDDVYYSRDRRVLSLVRFRLRHHGSKIVVTTRNGLVASTMGTSPEYRLGGLSDEDCHELLLKWAEKIQDPCGNLSNKCRMPEIVHDLAVFISEKECKGIASYRSGIVIPKGVQHVSIHDSDCSREEVTKSLFMLMNLRSVLYFPSQGAGANEETFIERCISRFKYLRVLDLSDSCFQVLPRYVGNLKHLRFLDLSGNASMEKLPNTICKLYNLQTLRIWYCKKIRKLPQNLGNLISLKHLYLTTQQSCFPEKQIRRLTSLRTLGIEGCGNLTSLPEGIQLLTALTTVTITTCPKLTSLPSSMKNMANLRNLEISKCPNLNLSGWKHFKGLKRLH
ncbi:hypothetical protein Acr_00g0103140 [Actinidia rufa]|uniref:NB-ARC domain-containing disease resistance protein n=1 Tax=Actinidia rufa TaxID=165716 RepID=A0A7J0E294_9ERIC|nr:hypothetical protein Acr_00g0103140 [Actinidia rufa]